MLPTSLPVGIYLPFLRRVMGKKVPRIVLSWQITPPATHPAWGRKKRHDCGFRGGRMPHFTFPPSPTPRGGGNGGVGGGGEGGGGGGNQPEGQDALFSGNWDLLSFPPLWPPLEDDRSPKRWWERCTWSWSLLFNTSQINLLFPYIPDVRLKWRQNIQNRPKKSAG